MRDARKLHMAKSSTSMRKPAISLKGFTSFIQESHLASLAEEHLRELKKSKGPITEVLSNLTQDEMRKMTIEALKAINALLVQWNSNKLTFSYSDYIPSEAAVEFFETQKKALNKYIPLYARDGKTAIALANKLNDFYNEAREVAIQTYLKIKDDSDRKIFEIKSVLDNPIVGICFLDEKGSFVSVNKAYAAMLGYDANALITMKWEDVIHQDDHKVIKSQFAALLKSGRAMVEARGKRKNGSSFSMEITMIFNEGSNGYYKGQHWFIKDISERVKLGDQLRQSEERYKAVIQQSSIIFFLAETSTGRVIEANLGLLELLGYSESDIDGLTVYDIIANEPKELDGGILKILKQKKYFNGNRHFKRVDDTLIDVELRANLISLGGEDVYCFISQDITKRKKTQEALDVSEAKFRSMIENSSDIVTILDRNGLIKSISPSVKYMLGHDAKDLENSSVFDIIHPGDIKNATKYFRLLSRNNIQKIPIDFRLLKKDGSWCNIEAIGNNLLDEPFIEGLILNCRDVTERKVAEQAMKESEHRYRSLLENMNEGLLYVDNDGAIRYVNDRFCEMLGYKNEELLGKMAHSLLLDKNMKNWIYIDKIQQGLEGKLEQYEVAMQSKSGDTVWALASATPDINLDGKIIGSMITHADITDRKHTEERLKDKNNELNTFVYKASHDLKGPLASIIGIANIAVEEIKNPAILTYFDMIVKSSQRLDSILMDLLELTRISQGTIQTSKVDVEQLTREILKSIEHAPSFSRIKFTLKFSQTKKLKTDRKLLTSILQNIIDNSVKYQNMSSKNPRVSIKIVDHNNGIKIEIADNGLGIEDDLKEKVFDMFFRGNIESKGTGLGLYIVKNSVEKLGGRIEMDSEIHVGTTFKLYLPNAK
ncbi:MAG: PAS domain S-box protein [Bacteroidetes bacterium]|nr:PAS domain S-box protein [Bacteroidota bacterium]